MTTLSAVALKDQRCGRCCRRRSLSQGEAGARIELHHVARVACFFSIELGWRQIGAGDLAVDECYLVGVRDAAGAARKVPLRVIVGRGLESKRRRTFSVGLPAGPPLAAGDAGPVGDRRFWNFGPAALKVRWCPFRVDGRDDVGALLPRRRDGDRLGRRRTRSLVQTARLCRSPGTCPARGKGNRFVLRELRGPKAYRRNWRDWFHFGYRQPGDVGYWPNWMGTLPAAFAAFVRQLQVELRAILGGAWP